MLTTASYLVLGLVRFAQSTTPYELKSLAESTVGPFWALPHTQIYAQCDKLVEAGLLHEERQQHGWRRRTLTITDEGRAARPGHPQALLRRRRRRAGPTQVREHEATLAKYEQWRRDFPEDTPAGILGALEFGVQYERWMVEFWSSRMRSSGVGLDTD